MRDVYQVPFDIRKSSRDNVLEWVGSDDRMMQLVEHCDLHGIALRFTPGTDWCYIDVMSPHGNVLAVGGDVHSMAIDLCGDRFILFGSEDIPAGLARIDEIFAGYSKKETESELKSLFRL